MIAIIDYGVGNLYNLKNALDFQHLPARIVSDPAALGEPTHIILPGVGAFGAAMAHLRASGMVEPVLRHVRAGRPFLGVCVGHQLLFEESEEGDSPGGLGLIGGRVVRFRHALKIPQIGWNQVAFRRADPLLEGIPDQSYFYFVHSYHAELSDPDDALGLTDYGVAFPSIVRHGNVWGVQFHPEKSQDAGLRLLYNFSRLRPE